MKTVRPHDFFQLDFDQIVEEGRRQTEIHWANQEEYSIVYKMHRFFKDVVLELIVTDDWVYEAAEIFVRQYATDCFHELRLGGNEVYGAQQSLHTINERVVDFLARANVAESAPQAGEFHLSKASEFLELISPDRLDSRTGREALKLHREARDQEHLQLRVTLRAIRDFYELTLPRVMYVIRRAIKVEKGLRPKPGDQELSGISDYISWYERHVDANHALFPVLGKLSEFYKVARNVGSHHKGFTWETDSNLIVLEDRNTTLRLHVHEFQQSFRYLTYLCELGLRGILAAYCRRGRGEICNELVFEYINTFPENFSAGAIGKLQPY